MYCNQCGKEIPNNSIFCDFCGVKIEQTNELSEEDPIIKACKDFVSKNLKAPATVKYNSIEIKERDQCGRILLIVEVDSQNGFGAYVRSKFHVILQSVNKDGSYKVSKHAFNIASQSERVFKNQNNWNLPKL